MLGIITSLLGVAGDGSRDLYAIVETSNRIFGTKYKITNWSRDVCKSIFNRKNREIHIATRRHMSRDPKKC